MSHDLFVIMLVSLVGALALLILVLLLAAVGLVSIRAAREIAKAWRGDA